MISKTNEKQLDEGAKEMVSVAFIASILCIPNLIKAQEIEKNIPNNASSEEIQEALDNTSKKEAKYGGYSAIQLGNIIARTLYGEAANQSFEGKEMIATVIYNRAGGKLENFAKVCFEKSQFSMWNNFSNKSPDTYKTTVPYSVAKNQMEKDAWEECQNISSNMINKTFEKLGKWNAYYNPKKASTTAKNTWGTKMTDVKTIGDHKFGYLEDRDGFKAPKTVKTKTYPKTYVIQKSDYKGLKSIAKKLIKNKQTKYTDPEKLMEDIIKLNNIKDRNVIKQGQVLKLPQNP